jgi:hypothetical protein
MKYELVNIKVGDVAEDVGYIYFFCFGWMGWGLLTGSRQTQDGGSSR